eukprot:621618-Prymnesium_polylepis.1
MRACRFLSRASSSSAAPIFVASASRLRWPVLPVAASHSLRYVALVSDAGAFGARDAAGADACRRGASGTSPAA